MSDDGPGPGQIAFEAYNESRGGVNFQGEKTPPWEELPTGIHNAWCAAATAVIFASQDHEERED